MIQTLNPSKTDEIMSRYRPIAPKPEIISLDANSGAAASISVPEKFRQSPYLRNIWSHLQARPTRTRKRAARSSTPIPSSAIIRHHHHHHKLGFVGLCSPSLLTSPAQNHHYHHYPSSYNIVTEKPIITLPLLPSGDRESIDLNKTAVEGVVLEERDLLLQVGSPNGQNRVISPRAVRAVGSSISVVGPISEDPEAQAVVKKAEEVEEAVEAEGVPVVISDRSNKVRMANSAYRELVGQPECTWLDSMMGSGSGAGTGPTKRRRMSGEVMLKVEEGVGKEVGGNGFSCWVRIEWEREEEKKTVNAFCNVNRLVCDHSKDYMYSWRFHTRDLSPSASKV